ncbi:MAG: hypothetical protein WA648_12340, partial [Methylocella sp.]
MIDDRAAKIAAAANGLKLAGRPCLSRFLPSYCKSHGPRYPRERLVFDTKGGIPHPNQLGEGRGFDGDGRG